MDGKEETETVTAVEKRDGAFAVKVRRVDRFGEGSDIEMRVSNDGLTRDLGRGFNGIPLVLRLLLLPHKEGATWETNTGAWPFGTSRFTAHGPEAIEVPGGKYDAIRAEARDAGKMGGDIRRCYWYAPGVGLVKSEFESGKSKSVRTLKSFSRGGQ